MTKRLDLYLNTPALGVVHAADVVLIEEQSRLQQVGFRYRPDYLASDAAFAIDPVQLPLDATERAFDCQGGAPAFIDDYLPDSWGRKVLARLALYRDGMRLDANSVIDTLSLLRHSRIGAVCLVDPDDQPQYETGPHIDQLPKLELAAQQLEGPDLEATEINEMGLLYLANAGSSVGGARPKALVHDDQTCYLGKFNIKQDAYNNARVEQACLRMAKAAGLEVGDSHVVGGINNRELVLLERFDTATNARHHVITANGLLKEPMTQQDQGHTFRYDDICALLRRYSCHVERDLQQLVRLMLFNRAINNTDDHERNTSLIHRGDGYQLAPAYDLMPSLTRGGYHAAGYQYRPNPPSPTEAIKLGRIFGLSKPTVKTIADQIIAALDQWPVFAQESGVDETEAVQISDCFHY